MKYQKINLKVVQKMAEKIKSMIEKGRVKNTKRMFKHTRSSSMLGAFSDESAWLKEDGVYVWNKSVKINKETCSKILYNFVTRSGRKFSNFPEIEHMEKGASTKSNKSVTKETEPVTHTTNAQHSNVELAGMLEDFIGAMARNADQVDSNMNSIKAAMFDYGANSRSTKGVLVTMTEQIKSLAGSIDELSIKLDKIKLSAESGELVVH